MKTKNLFSRSAAGAALFMALLGSLTAGGCGSAGDSGPSKTDDAAKLETAKTARGYFDKVQGNYESLSAADKAAYVKLLGGDKPATDLWNTMKGAGTPSGAAPVGAPTGAPGVTTGPR